MLKHMYGGQNSHNEKKKEKLREIKEMHDPTFYTV